MCCVTELRSRSNELPLVGAVKLQRMLVGSLDEENEKNAAARRPATVKLRAGVVVGLGIQVHLHSAGAGGRRYGSGTGCTLGLHCSCESSRAHQIILVCCVTELRSRSNELPLVGGRQAVEDVGGILR